MADGVSKRDTYKYVLKVNGVIIYRDVTNDLVRRAIEHKARYPNSQVVQIGRRTTREQALKWKRRYERK